MSPTTKKPEPELLPLRACTSCEQHFEASHVTWVGGQWFCPDCHLDWKAEQEAPAQYATEAAEAKAAQTERRKSLERIDAGFRYGSGLGRFGGYGIGFYMASKYTFVNQLLHGVVLADVLTWIFLCWFDARFHRLPVILEFIGFVILTTLILGGDKMSEFESNEAMGMAFLGFLITFATKGLYRVHRYWTSGSSEAE
ncbi:MAG: hypothetical protein ACYTGW_13825 [Planctomycetota bacterium]|jgi:hypothetical protein